MVGSQFHRTLNILPSLNVFAEKGVVSRSIRISKVKLRVEADGFVQVLNGALKLAKLPVGNAPVQVGQGKLRVEADGLVVVLDGPLWLKKLKWGSHLNGSGKKRKPVL